MKGYLYKTECLANNKIYIGISVSQRNRGWYIGSGVALKDAIKKYGKSNFRKTVLVDDIETLDELNRLEKEYIEKYNCLYPNGYNLDVGGKSTGNHSAETKWKISCTKKGVRHSAERVEANRKGHTGLRLSQRTKDKISAATKGKKMPAGFAEKIRVQMLGNTRNQKEVSFKNLETGAIKNFAGQGEAAIFFEVDINTVSRIVHDKYKKQKVLAGVWVIERKPKPKKSVAIYLDME